MRGKGGGLHYIWLHTQISLSFAGARIGHCRLLPAWRNCCQKHTNCVQTRPAGFGIRLCIIVRHLSSLVLASHIFLCSSPSVMPLVVGHDSPIFMFHRHTAMGIVWRVVLLFCSVVVLLLFFAPLF